jgi:hypothetical protein
MAAIANLFIDQGSTFSTSVNVKDSDESAFDLTNHTAAGQVRKSYSSSTATDFTITIADPPSNGQIDCQLTATQTAALEEGRYVYDVEVTSDTGTVTRVIEGIITINPNVTK